MGSTDVSMTFYTKYFSLKGYQKRISTESLILKSTRDRAASLHYKKISSIDLLEAYFAQVEKLNA